MRSTSPRTTARSTPERKLAEKDDRIDEKDDRIDEKDDRLAALGPGADGQPVPADDRVLRALQVPGRWRGSFEDVRRT
jgi:hypothetical protein